MTPAGGYYRRQIFILSGGIVWGILAYLNHLPSAQVFATLNLIFYPLRIFVDLQVVVTLLVGLVCFQLILVITLILLHRPMRRLLYWLPMIFALGLFVFWLAWGPYLTFPQWNMDDAMTLVLYPLQALLAPRVLMVVLVAALSFWVAYRTAAIYLDDIYELGDIQLARRFILQAVFSSQYNFIAIREGEVQSELKKSPVYRIGGPGLVRVHLDSAALFEAIDGTPRVIGPTFDQPRGMAVLSGFERLRSIIDLRDQMNKYSLTGRTRDGIRIHLKDVNTLFSVYRGGQNASLMRPYPFDPLAIKRLVYGQGTTSWVTATDSLTQRKFKEFIAQHSLSEFLAAVGAPEMEQARLAQAELRQAVEALAGASVPVPVQPPANPPDFYSRADVITELFSAEFAEEAARRGVEIKWIGGGTWELPDSIVPQRHLEAWKLSRENLLRSSPAAMQQVNQESQVAELARLVDEVPIATYQSTKELPSRDALRKLLLAYYKVLHEAYESYQQNPGDPAQMEWLRKVLVFLTRFTATWLGGP
jgi:hypothetical protein